MTQTEYNDMIAEMKALRVYRVIRLRQNGNPRTIKSNLTLTEAQNHCKREDAHGPGWFDGFDYIKGCSPKLA